MKYTQFSNKKKAVYYNYPKKQIIKSPRNKKNFLPHISAIRNNVSINTKIKILPKDSKRKTPVYRNALKGYIVPQKVKTSLFLYPHLPQLFNRRKHWVNRNTDVVNTEFYQLWFCTLPLTYLINKNNFLKYRPSGEAARLWSIFRDARFSREARWEKNKFKLNWPKALLYKEKSKKGFHRYNLLRDLRLAVGKRLDGVIDLENKSNLFMKEALRSKTRLTAYDLTRKVFSLNAECNYYRRIAKVYYYAARSNFGRYNDLNCRYLAYVKKHSFINNLRSDDYANIFTSFNNAGFDSSVSSWKQKFNLTKRKAFSLENLLNKRNWSALHNLAEDVRFSSLRLLTSNLKKKRVWTKKINYKPIYWQRSKPFIRYKLFLDPKIKKNFKSKTTLKTDKPSKNKFSRLRRKINKLKNKIFRSYTNKLKRSVYRTIKSLKYRSELFLQSYKNLRVFNNVTPIAAYHLPKHLRKTTKRRPMYGLTINLAPKNYFFTVTNIQSGGVKKVFSSGYSKGKTTKIRRSLLMFSRVFSLLLDYLKTKNITKLSYTRVIQFSTIPNSISFQDEKKLSWYPKQLKKNKIKVGRWIYELKRIHALPIRGRKLRRK